MFGKIAIILAVFMVLVFPVSFLLSSTIDRLASMLPTLKMFFRYIEFVSYLIPVYAIIVVTLGHKSIAHEEGYGMWLKVSMGVSYFVITMVVLFIIFIIYKLMTEGLNLGGIR